MPAKRPSGSPRQAMESEAELLTRDRHWEAVDGLAWRRLE